MVGNMKLIVPGVRALIFDRQGRLLLERQKAFGSWSLPHGCVDLGESAYGALFRAELWGASGRREMADGMGSHAARLYHVGARPVTRSTLADANALRPSEVFSGLFAALVKPARRGLRRKIGESVYLIDSTGVRLSALSADWARYSTGVCGAKAHVIYDPDADHPVYVSVTPSRLNDITAAQEMPIEAGAT